MFLKKLLGSNNDKGQDRGKTDRAAPPQGVQTMGVNLQRKFAKGVQYNMKIVVKGDRNVGKSCLFYRLQGQKFKEEYLPTDEIQATSIQWNYKATDDIVKVEVWDVVDRGKRKKKTDGLKLDTHLDGPPSTSDPFAEGGGIKPPSQQAPAAGMTDDPCLDAEFLDVYKGTHGVIMMFDVTKQWTFTYVERELPKVPAHIPVLVLANHRDMGHHRTVSEDTVRYFIEEQRQGEDGADIRYAESSMRNGYGLKYIHKFFNLPFLQLQRETLLRQLKTNSRERELTIEELNLQEGSEDQNYELYLEALTAKKHDQEKMERCPSDRSLTDQSTTLPTTTDPTPNGRTTAPSTGLRQAPPPHTIPGLMVTTPTSPVAPPGGGTTPNSAPPSGVASKSAPVTPAATPQQEQKSGGFMSRLFGNKNKEREKKEQEQQQQQLQVAVADPVLPQTSIKDVDDFVPFDQLDSSFLDDATEAKETREAGGEDSESDEESTSNPLVAGFQDDIDSDDQQSARNTDATASSTHIELSSDEEEEVAKSQSVAVTLSQDNVSDSGSPMPSSSRSDLQLPIQWTPGGDTSHDDDGSKPLDVHAEVDSPQQDQSGCHGNTRARHVSDESDKSDDKDSDADDVPTVTVQEDDVSDDDAEGTIVADHPVEDTPSDCHNTPEAGDHVDSPPQPLPTLQFEDFAVLDRDFDDPTGQPGVECLSDITASSSRTGSDLECGPGSHKKKKHRSKDKDGERKKKHKKHREKGEKGEKEGEEEEGKKKRKSKLKPAGNEMDELEAFLGPAGDSGSAAKTSDYEVL